MYEAFKTDKELEKNGVVVDYDKFRVTIARAGGGNNRYKKCLENKTRPHKRAIQSDTLSNDVGEKISIDVFVATIILDWEVKDDKGAWIQGLENSKGKIVPFTKENVIELLTDIPDLWNDIREQSTSNTIFREVLLEEDLKNF